MKLEDAQQLAQDIKSAGAFLYPIEVTNNHEQCPSYLNPCDDGYVVVTKDLLTDKLYYYHNRLSVANFIRGFK